MIQVATLRIRALELLVFLGWPDNERKDAQTIWLDIDIRFAHAPLACLTDDLNDTLCYSKLTKHIHENLSGKYFHLIEHLAQEVYNVVKHYLNQNDKLTISITKHPKIQGLTNGVCFSLGD